jgi:hypothetical protein
MSTGLFRPVFTIIPDDEFSDYWPFVQGFVNHQANTTTAAYASATFSRNPTRRSFLMFLITAT